MTIATADPSLIFSGIARVSTESLTNTTEHPPKQTQRTVPTSYINLEDLITTIENYYLYALDKVDPSNVNLPLDKLVPGNTLVSQLEQSDMEEALNQLPNDLEYEIYCAHNEMDFDVYQYGYALEYLSPVIHKKLNEFL